MDEKNLIAQIYPSKVRVVPNCKLAKVTSKQTKAQAQKLIDGKIFNIVEKKNHKKHGDILTPYTITNADGYDGTDPLNFFDYSVLSVCISEQLAGNTCTTPAIILRGLTGKTKNTNGGNHNGVINKDQRDAIIASITKLMGRTIKINLSDVNKKLDYNGSKTITSTLLPAYFVTTTINGQIIEDAIFFDRQSPIFEVAEQRNQIIRYDNILLDVPNQNNTPLVITIKNYVMLRVMEIIKHKMTPTITIADVFQKCRIDAAGKKYNVVREVKNVIDKFLAHLQSKNVIKSFHWKKNGTKIHGVEFTF